MVTRKVEIDFNRNGDFDHPLSDVSDYVRDGFFFSAGWFNVGQVESNVAAHIAPVNSFQFVLDNRERMFSYEYLGAALYNQLEAGLMARVTVTHAGISHSWTYFTQSISEDLGKFGNHTVTVNCVCAMPRVQRANYEPAVTTDISTSAALIDMMEDAVLIVPYTSDYFIIDGSSIDGTALIFDPATDVDPMIDFESGLTTLDYVGDVLYRERKGLSVQKAQLFIADMCMAEAYGRFYYQPRDNKFHFHNRYHDKLEPTTLTLTSADYTKAIYTSTPVFNEIAMHYQPRIVGDAGATLFLSQSVPVALSVGQQRDIRVRFTDSEDSVTPLAGLTIIDPVAGTDIIVTTSGGDVVTNDVYKSADLKGAGGTLFFHNQTSENVTIDKIQVRGTPITLPQPEIAKATDGESMITYNWLPMPDLKGSYITDPEFAQNVVNFLISRHATMRREVESVSVIVTDDNYIEIMGVSIGDVICVQDDWLGHDTEYVVLGEQHNYNIAQDVWTVQWWLRSNDTTPYFMIDTSYIDGNDIIGY